MSGDVVEKVFCCLHDVLRAFALAGRDGAEGSGERWVDGASEEEEGTDYLLHIFDLCWR